MLGELITVQLLCEFKFNELINPIVPHASWPRVLILKFDKPFYRWRIPVSSELLPAPCSLAIAIVVVAIGNYFESIEAACWNYDFLE